MYSPNYHPNIRPNLTLYTITEKYPDQENAQESCKNGAGVLFLTQKLYECRFTDNAAAGPSDWMNVTEETFNIMEEYPYYKERAECNSRDVMNKVCLCPSGFTDYLCETQLPRKCYV